MAKMTKQQPEAHKVGETLVGFGDLWSYSVDALKTAMPTEAIQFESEQGVMWKVGYFALGAEWARPGVLWPAERDFIRRCINGGLLYMVTWRIYGENDKSPIGSAQGVRGAAQETS